MKIDWDLIRQGLYAIYKLDVLKINGNKATVKFGPNNMAFLIPDERQEGVVRLMLRASMLPNDASVISIVVSSLYKVALDAYFEYKVDGGIVYGQQALDEAIKALTYSYPEPPEFRTRFIEQQRDNPN